MTGSSSAAVWLTEGLRVSLLPSGELYQGVYEAVDAAGYEPGLLSGGPIDIARRFVETKLKPTIEARRDEFYLAVGEAVEALARDEFSGPLTASILFTAGAADALMKVLPRWFAGELDFSGLTVTDCTMMALLWTMASKRSGSAG